MALARQGDKTEKATPQKLRKLREEGQVPRSRDWAVAVAIFISLQMIVWLAPRDLEAMRELFVRCFAAVPGNGKLDDAFSQILPLTLGTLLKMLLPLLVIPLVVIVASLLPGGWSMSLAPLQPRLKRLSPAQFLGRLLSGRHLLDTGMALLKGATLMTVLYWMARSDVSRDLHLASLPVNQALASGVALMLRGIMALCAVFIAFAVIDLPMQWLLFMRMQRMSKAEVKEELKTSEGRPEVRQRIRQLQTQMARRAIRKSVPTADVVIVNPEHYAVALKYDEARAAAPFVVAKGIDEMAQYIRAVARECDVEVVTLPPLARAVYNTSQVNQQIPAVLYTAVAQVLSYVVQIRAFRGGRQHFEPEPPSELGIPVHLSGVST